MLFGTAAVCLRSEREGTERGRQPRIYTITLATRDGAGNETTRDVTVTVPHDQGGTKCPKTPASLHVEDNDPACTENVPGIPVPVAAVEPPPAARSGCSVGVESLPWLASLLLALHVRRRRTS